MSTSSHRSRREPTPDHALAIDTRSLGRVPGAVMGLHTEAVLPESVGAELMRLPEGSEVRLDLDLTCVEEGVLVTGPVSGTATVECARCLGEVHAPASVVLTELYAYPGTPTAAGADSDEVRLLDDDVVDLMPALVDAFGLEFPLAPTCELAGLDTCVEAATPPPDGVSGETSGRVDPRWAALVERFGDTADEPASGEGEAG